jgi:hypothetical protein
MALLNRNVQISQTAIRVARRGGFELHEVNLTKLSYTSRSTDLLSLRAMWRRARRPLEKLTVYVGGKVLRFLAP